MFGNFIVGSALLFSSCGARPTGTDVDVCRCLTEPGNSEYMTTNEDACRDAISTEIGVENWEAVNMSQDLAASSRFDALAKRCQ
jgi:hypothetical protein